MKRWKYVTILVLALFLVVVGGLYAALRGDVANPFEGEKVYTNPESQPCVAMRSIRDERSEDADKLKIICDAPKAVWLGDWIPDIEQFVRETIEKAEARGELPVFVTYNIPQRDATGGFSAGGAKSGEAYLTWTQSIAQSIGDTKAVIVHEPDALASLDSLSVSAQEERLSLIRQSTAILKDQPNTSVYIDTGNVTWHDSETIAAWLERADIANADGFSLNVSNFYTVEETIRYGVAISEELGDDVPFVIDSSRSGLGPATEIEERAWCNPPGRALGALGYVPEHDLVHWVGYIKVPGESDGECRGGLPAGDFWIEYALGLVERAQEHNTLNE